MTSPDEKSLLNGGKGRDNGYDDHWHDRFQKHGQWNSDEKDELIQIAKSTFYPKRNYSKTLNESNLDDEKKSKLINFIRTSPDIKKEDAKELIKYIAGMVK